MTSSKDNKYKKKKNGKNATGRPETMIDVAKFKKLCQLQCTQSEVAGFFDCREDTITNWCNRTFDLSFSDCNKRYGSEPLISMRRKQINMAIAGDKTMLVWCGKQYLGQKEKAETITHKTVIVEHDDGETDYMLHDL